MGLIQTLSFILNHPMNCGKRNIALARFVKWQVQSRVQDEVLFDWIDGATLAVRRGMTGATGNIYCGLHEYVDMSFVLHSLKRGDLFADIGANVGSYTVLASKICGADTIAAEPDPQTAGYLRRNIEVNGIENNVQVVEAALGAREGSVCFTVGLDTVNRVAKPSDKNVRVVPVKTLDDVLKGIAPSIMKLDVEGYEADVLNGATATLLDPNLKVIIIETVDEDVKRILHDAGFGQSYYDPKTRTLSSLPNGIMSHNSIMLRDATDMQKKVRPL
jgi:FkbM family methyltransferase